MLVGQILNAKDIMELWREAEEKGYIEQDGTVVSQDLLAGLALHKLGRTDIGFIFGDENRGTPIGYRIKVPYTNEDSHFVLGDINKNLIYNPGNTYSEVHLGYRRVSVYAK
jgi:hypothetical protein